MTQRAWNVSTVAGYSGTPPLGFVDIKVCAIEDGWSGLKLVVRKELR